MRVVLWLLLGLSSVPLHLLYVYILSNMDRTLIEASYNSTVYSTIRATEYAVIVVNEKFVDNNTKTYDRDTSGDHGKANATIALEMGVIKHMFSLSNAGQLDQLDKMSCAKAYGQSYQSARGSVLLVTSSNVSGSDDGALADWLSDVAPVMDFEMVDVNSPRYDPFRWMCGQYNMTNQYCSTFLPTILRNIHHAHPGRSSTT
jgi:hypothetical protein